MLRRADALELSREAQQRLKWFLYAAHHDGNVSKACRYFGISRSTYLRWASRFDVHDASTLEEHSRRPHHVRLPETDEQTVALIRTIREEHPTMGKDAIAQRLLQEHGVRVSASTVGRVIQRHGFFFADSAQHQIKRRVTLERVGDALAPSALQRSLPLFDAPDANEEVSDDTENGAIGLPLAALLVAVALGAVWTTPTAHAAESANYQLIDGFSNQGEHVGATSTTYGLRGGLTWFEQPLTSTSYQIVTDPTGTGDGGGATGGTGGGTGDTGGTGGGGGTGDDVGGHRGHGTNVHPPVGSVIPPGSSASSTPTSTPTSSASPAPSSTAASTSSERQLPAAPIVPRVPQFDFGTWPNMVLGKCPVGEHCFLSGRTTITAQCPDCEMLCTQRLHAAAGRRTWFVEFILALTGLGLAMLEIFRLRREVKNNAGKGTGRTPRRVKRAVHAGRTSLAVTLLVAVAAALAAVTLWITPASAATTAPLMHVYNGHLLNSSSEPVTTAVNIRFSYWTSADFQAGDVDGAGGINTGAATYADWTEVHAVTPDANGYFSVHLGSGTALPSMSGFTLTDLVSLHLQVEVKPLASADTSYELLDPNANDVIDRSPVLSVPFALNADLLDQRDTGTGSGDIAILETGGTYSTSVIPGGTNAPRFVIDADGSTSSGTLLFGGNLTEYLRFNAATDRFEFSDDVFINGNLTVNGLINGVDITNLSGGGSGALFTSSGGGLTINITGGSYRIDGHISTFAGQTGVAVTGNTTNYVFLGSGGLKVYTTGFPTDESYIALAEVATNAGAVTNIDDIRPLISDDRTHTVKAVLHPEYPGASYVEDGTDNTGQLSIQKDGSSLYNYYQWTSSRTSLQDYQVSLRYTLPDDFVRFGSGIYVTYRSSTGNTADNQLDIAAFDTAGNAMTLGGSATDLANTSWTTTALTVGGSPVLTPGQEIVVVLTLSAMSNNQIHLGDIEIVTVSLDRE